MDQLYFNLRPSLSRLGIMVTLFIILSAVFSHYFNGVLFGFLMLLTLVGLYFVHDKNPLTALAHMDAKTWTLKFKDGSLNTSELQRVQRMGSLIFLYFQDNEQKKRNICITKDQLDVDEWKRLQTFIELS